MRIWTPEARAAQSALAKRLKPWTRSTGPKTPAGKAKAAKNSFKTGAYSKARKEIRRYLSDCRAYLKFLKTKCYKFPDLMTVSPPCDPFFIHASVLHDRL